MKRNLFTSLIANLVVSAVVAGAGVGTAVAADPIKMAVTNWADVLAVANVAKYVLENNLKQPVQFVQADIGIQYQGVARGDLDIMVGGWGQEGLPLMDRVLRDSREGSTADILTSRLRLLAHAAQQVIASRLTRSDAVQQGVSDWFAEMWEAGQRLESPLIPLLFAGLEWWPERSMQVVDATILVLSSHTDRHVVNAALSSAGRWLLREQQTTEATQRYAEYLVACVRSDSERCLDLKLRSIGELLDLGAQRHFDEYKQRLCAGLNSLLFELQDARPASNSFVFASRPLLRSAIASLLAAMHAKVSGVSSEPTFKWAVDMARKDSLRNVRVAV